MIRNIIFLFPILLYSYSVQADILKDFDSLGGNDVLLKEAHALNPESRVQIVQNRVVKRSWRHEFSPEIGYVWGGEAYLKTQNLGLRYDVHINPKWSVGLRYNYYFNQLSEEGDNLIAEKSERPDIDWPKQSYMAMVSWYPIYGKLNFFGMGVTQFDVYLTGGLGQVELRSGATSAYTLGGGIGFWLSQHLTVRMELKYQTYQAQRYTDPQDMQLTVGQFSMGYLL